MPESVIALLIMAVTMFLFISGKIPLGITAMLGAVAMSLFGIIPYSAAFAPFGSDTVMMVAGMLTIGNAMFETGFAAVIGESIAKIKGFGTNERRFLLLIVTITAIMSAFFSNTATVAIFLPLVTSVSLASEGKITRKNTYMAVGLAAVAGGNMTLIGSTPQLLAQGVLQAAGGEVLGFFTLLPGALPAFFVMLLYYSTIGYKLQNKVFTFEEKPCGHAPETASKQGNSRIWICSGIFAAVVLGCFFEVATFGTVAIVGACLCVITGCISVTRAFALMDWMSILVLGGSLGLAEGLNQSGAISLVAQSTLALLGGAHASPWIASLAIAIICSLLSNVMSTTATAAVMTPFVIGLANSMGVRPLTYVIMVIISVNVCFTTPINTPPITMTLSAGYRFKDYIIVGGLLNILALTVSAICVPLLYGF